MATWTTPSYYNDQSRDGDAQDTVDEDTGTYSVLASGTSNSIDYTLNGDHYHKIRIWSDVVGEIDIVLLDGGEVLRDDWDPRGGWNEIDIGYATTKDFRIRIGGNSSSNKRINEVDVVLSSAPTAPQNLSATAISDSQIDLTWDPPSDWGGDKEGYRIYRSTSSGGSYTQIDSVGASTTSYSDTGLNSGTTYYYVVTAYNSVGESSYSNEDSATTDGPPAAPSTVTLTMDADDQATVTWEQDTSGTSVSDYDIEILRDGGAWLSPSGGPSNVSDDGSSTYTETYAPNSDNAYGTQVGIDSSFRFRVRANNSNGSSDWTYSGTKYTTPVPPHNPSVNRPDANTIEVTFAHHSDIENDARVDIEYRKDTGSGYSSWQNAEAIGGASKGTTTTRTYSVSSDSFMEADARYQFRLAHYLYQDANNDGSNELWESAYIYADYGNQGNVYFEDDFEDGDVAEWDYTNQDIVMKTGGLTDAGVSGPDSGSYYVQLDSGGRIEKNIGDLSSESDAIVKCAMGAGSMDTGNEYADLEWYDGSSWQNLRTLGWEFNRQGWVEVTALVPSSYLSTDNRVAFEQEGGGGDFTIVDHVVVSDIIHEYTAPAAASSLSEDTSIEDEIALSWANNAAFNDRNETYHKRTSDASWTQDGTISATATSYIYSPLDDGERYDLRVRPVIDQPRHGSTNNRWYVDSSITATALLPAPTSLSTSNVTADSVDLAWTDNHDYGDTKVQYKPSDTSTWTTFSTLSIGTDAETVTGLRNGEQYDLRVIANTEHTQTEDV